MLDFFFRNIVYFLIFFTIIFFLIYLILNYFDEDGVSSLQYFFHFGPSKGPHAILDINGEIVYVEDPEQIDFFLIPINTWTKLIITYILSFFLGFLMGLLNIIYLDLFYNLLNTEENYIEKDKKEFVLTILSIPLLILFLMSSGFFFSVFQFQFLIFFILGIQVIIFPYAYHKTRNKKFIGYEEK